MSKWTNATLTADGQNLQAQLLDGGGFEFTKVTAADSSGTDKLTLTMQPSVIAGKTITVPVLLSNSNLSAGFTMNQLKFYARKTGIPAGDEIVYAIAEDETGDEIPSESDSPGFTIDWSYTFQFGNATSVNVSIDPAGLVSMALLGSPGGIATLNNAGAVPIEQGGTGAVTASAALAALGGMRASATGDDIPTSASDPTSISSQLSKKAEWMPNNWKTEADAPSAYPLNSATTFFSGNSFAGIDQCIVTTYAYNLNAARQIVSFLDNTGVKYRLAIGEDQWGAWKQISTATPPEVRNFTIQSGFTAGDCTFFVTQESAVFLAGGVSGTLPANQDTQIGTLPSDVCPSKQRRRPAVTNAGAAYIDIHTDGTVWAHPFVSASQCWFDTSFVAGGGS